MADITGNEILGRALKNEGTRDLFFIMGGPMQHAETACAKEGIRMIDVRHEQAAALSAQAYARLKQPYTSSDGKRFRKSIRSPLCAAA